MFRRGLPREPDTRKHFIAAVDVVFQLGPERQPKRLAQCDFVLQENIAPAQIAVGGKKSEPGRVAHTVHGVAIARAPEKRVRRKRSEAMLELHVERVERLAESTGVVAPR